MVGQAHLDQAPAGRPYTIIRLDQRSPAWHEWRWNGLGASDAPTIMGESRWKSREALLHDKIYGEADHQNGAMSRGVTLEPVARRHFEKLSGVRFAPRCLQSTALDWLRASTDGLSTDRTRVIEIKCGQSAYRTTACTGLAPVYYYGQLQHILAVTGLPAIDFVCYHPGQPLLHLPVPRDEPYIATLLDAENAFWELVLEQRRRLSPGSYRQTEWKWMP